MDHLVASSSKWHNTTIIDQSKLDCVFSLQFHANDPPVTDLIDALLCTMACKIVDAHHHHHLFQKGSQIHVFMKNLSSCSSDCLGQILEATCKIPHVRLGFLFEEKMV